MCFSRGSVFSGGGQTRFRVLGQISFFTLVRWMHCSGNDGLSASTMGNGKLAGGATLSSRSPGVEGATWGEEPGADSSGRGRPEE